MRYQVGDLPVPGYRLEKFLGAGSYGEVWRAVGPGGVPCALKFISMDSKSGLKEFRSIRLVKRLQHPNLCPVQAIWLRDPDGNVLSDTGEDSISIRLMGPKELVIAMGLGQKSLAQRLEECRAKGGIPPRELLRYMGDAAKGIDYLNSPDHDLGDGPAAIIHCDIKPANLLIVGGGVQVCDYGVAKALAPDSKKTFAAGTPAYAPAELINNEPCPQTDQYSLAITYYELRTGQLPFDEAKAIVANLMGQLDLSGVGPDEQAVLRQATHKQPAKRFESCEEFVEALKVAAGVTLGPSGVVSAAQTRRAAPAPPPEEPAPARARPVVPPPPPPPPPPARKTLSDLLQPGGEVVPDHFLNKLLGRGGFGEVWEARASGGVRCALKVVRDLQGKGKHEFAVLDKIRELDHPNLVQLRGYWLLAPDGSRIPAHKVGQPGVPDPAAVIISTDLAEKNLLDRLKECRQEGLPGIPAEELIGHVRQAAVALDYLNVRHHIQHRDVKPENLLLRGDRLLVSDFGLAKLVEGDDGVVASSSSGMTLEYAAPELLQKKVSSRTDQYSLALTYYTLRTGRMPFPAGMGQFDTMQARIKGQLDLSGVADPEQAVLRRALSPNPADRFASCEELARALTAATGVGSGPMPALPASGPLRSADLSRATPTGPAPRETPRDHGPPAAFAAPEAPTRSGHPLDTPRASSQPAEVPLTPAAAAAGGTILFGHGPAAGPEPAGPRDAPRFADEGPAVRATKSGAKAPKWNEAEPTGGGGRTVAVVAGVAVLVAGAAVGAYFLVNQRGSGTVASAPTGNTTQPTSTSVASIGGGTGGTVSTATGGGTSTGKAGTTGGATGTQPTTKAGGTGTTPPKKDDRLARALVHFHPPRDIPAGLEALAAIPEANPDHPRAAALKAAWERARTAAALPVADAAGLLKFRDEYRDLRPPAGSADLTDADRDDLRAYYRELLAEKVQTAVPGLGDKTPWADVAALCEEAGKAAGLSPAAKGLLSACRTECRAELGLPRDDTDPPPPTKADGYPAYAAALRAWKAGTDAAKVPDAAADAAAALVPAAAPTAGDWPNPHRLGRLADLLAAAAGRLRTPDEKDLEHPYPADGKAIPWLVSAARAAGLAKRDAKDRDRLAYEELLARWSKAATDGAAAGLADRLGGAKFAAGLPAAARARFGVVLAAARPADAVAGYRLALDALRSEGSPTLRGFVARAVLTRLSTGAAALPAGKEAAALLADAGRAVYRHRRAWAEAKAFPDRPAAVAAALFDRAAERSGRAADHAWRGVCRADLPQAAFDRLEADLAAARKADGASAEPAVLLLEGVVAARRPWKEPAVRPDLKDQIAAAAAADAKYREGLRLAAGEPAPEDGQTLPDDRRDVLAVLYDRAAVNAIALANLDPSDRQRQAGLLADAVRWANALTRVGPDRVDGLDVRGCAEEDQAWLLKPADRFAANGAYARADQTFAAALPAAGARPEARVHRGRNLFKWAEDAFYARAAAAPDEAKLAEAEKLFTTALEELGAAPRPATAAECRYWLGRLAVLRYLTAPDGPAKPRLYAQAVAEYAKAAGLTADPGAAGWADAVGQGLLLVHAVEGGRLARSRGAKEAEEAAAALDALAGPDAPVRLPPPVRAKAKAEAVRIRQRLDVLDEGNWYPKLKAAIEPGLKDCQTQDLGVQFELRVMLAEATASERTFKVNKPAEAVQYLEPAEGLAETTKFVPAETRADLLGTLGFLRFELGLARGEKEDIDARDKEWSAAGRRLEAALDLAPTHAKAWKWKYAQSVIAVAEAKASEQAAAKAATAAARGFHLFRDAELAAYGLVTQPAGADPDDLALAKRVWEKERAGCYKTCRPFVKAGLEKAADAPEAVLWRLADAELAAATTGKFDRGTAERAELNKALKAARDALPKLPADARKLGERMTTRIEDFLTRFAN